LSRALRSPPLLESYKASFDNVPELSSRAPSRNSAGQKERPMFSSNSMMLAPSNVHDSLSVNDSFEKTSAIPFTELCREENEQLSPKLLKHVKSTNKDGGRRTETKAPFEYRQDNMREEAKSIRSLDRKIKSIHDLNETPASKKQGSPQKAEDDLGDVDEDDTEERVVNLSPQGRVSAVTSNNGTNNISRYVSMSPGPSSIAKFSELSRPSLTAPRKITA